MSRYEDVLIDTDAGIDVVAARIEELLGSEFQIVDGSVEPQRALVLGERRYAWLDDADFVDEPGLPFSEFRYLLEVRAGERTDSADDQEQLAHEVYDRLVAGTDWRLMLLFNDLQRFQAQRDRLATAGR
jgi:hypothetical protein